MSASASSTMRWVRRAAAAMACLALGAWSVSGVDAQNAKAPVESAAKPAAVTSGPADIQRGEYLARAGDCVACHTTRGGQPFAGGLEMATPFGKLYTPNITPDRDTGIGKWSGEDFWQALHFGRMPNGSPYYPAFPYPNYTRVTRADADAIFAYLKSIKPVRQKNRPHEMGFPYNQRALLNGWRTLYFEPGVYENAASQSAEWNRGAYLVQGLGHCDACHTGRNILGATRKGAAFAGGVMPVQEWYAPSLTSNRESGLGQWEIEEIVAFLHTGVSRRGAVYGPMAQVVYDSLQYMTEADVRAMAVYLKSLLPKGTPDQPTQIRTTEQHGKELYETGAKLYEKWCADCHLKNGAGIPPAYPPLANNQSISMEFAANPVRMVMFGGYPPATAKNPRPFGMPPFAQVMNDQEIAAVVTYIRQSWGNRAAAVSSADVGKYRAVPLE
jgi:mono/diheme cytochrome c family protein